MDLFSTSKGHIQPLAFRMRPRTLEEYAGQEHIVGKGKLLRRAIQKDQLSSLIFYGPPGTGKTALAQVIAGSTKSVFSTMNAVLSGVKELRDEIKQAKERLEIYNKRTVLFIDEVHRWNKAQQDALLPWVENGTIILIGATTENPFFEVNSALVSRSKIFQLTPLANDDLKTIITQTLDDQERGYGKLHITFEPAALEHLIKSAAGDARSLLNALELAVETTPASTGPVKKSKTDDTAKQPGLPQSVHITLEIAEESIRKKVVLYDKEGDYHFDTISAFIKSIRGSDPDAALYWLAKMVHAGEDPKFILRRMLIAASEDVGMADPQALVVTEAAARAFEQVGMPEGRFHLAQAALYLATAPKSNTTMAFFDALKSVTQEEDTGVPAHLKDPNRDAKELGHGAGYLYPHAYNKHWIAQQYLPDELQGRFFYDPSDQGYEGHIQQEVFRKRELQLAAAGLESGLGDIDSLDDSFQPGPQQDGKENAGIAAAVSKPQILSFSPASAESRSKDEWLKRAFQSRSSSLTELQKQLFERAECSRHHTVLDLAPEKGIVLWEACRKVPEGGVYGAVENPQQWGFLTQYAGRLNGPEQPVLAKCSLFQFINTTDIKFDRIMGFNPLTTLFYDNSKATPLSASSASSPSSSPSGSAIRQEFFNSLKSILNQEGLLVICQVIPGRGTRLSSLLTLDDHLKRKHQKSAGPPESSIETNSESSADDKAASKDAESSADDKAASKDAVEPDKYSVPYQRIIDVLKEAEELLYGDPATAFTGWDEFTFKKELETAGFSHVMYSIQDIYEERAISKQEIERKLSPGSKLGDTLLELIKKSSPETPPKAPVQTASQNREDRDSQETAAEMRRFITNCLAGKPATWRSDYIIIRGMKIP